jgi:hypothetical protein
MPEGRGVVPATGRFTTLPSQLRQDVRAWVVRQASYPDPHTGYLLLRAEVADLTDGLVPKETVGRWWNAAVPEPPADVVGWRPHLGGPSTLRQYLESRGLPAGVSLARNRNGVLGDGMSRWARAWALAMLREPGTRIAEVIRLSGGLVTHAPLMRAWLRRNIAG